MTDPLSDQPLALPHEPRQDSRTAAGRRGLDETARRQIIRLVTLGSSRRMAARVVGCAASTITRTAARDPQFAAELARAEAKLETRMLHCIRKAAQTQCHWRAAAWLLERKNPQEFAPRPPGVLTVVEVYRMFAEVLASLGGQIADENRRRAMDALETLLLEADGGAEVIRDVEHDSGRSEQKPGASGPAGV